MSDSSSPPFEKTHQRAAPMSMGVFLNRQSPSGLRHDETVKEFCVRIQSAIANDRASPVSLRDALRDAAIIRGWFEMRVGARWTKPWNEALPDEPLDWSPRQEWAAVLPWLVPLDGRSADALIQKGLRSVQDGEPLIHAGLALSGDRLPHKTTERWLSDATPDQDGLDRLAAAITSAPTQPNQNAQATRSTRMVDVLFMAYQGGSETSVAAALKGCTKTENRLTALLELIENVETFPTTGSQTVILNALAKSFVAAARHKKATEHQWRLFSDICELILEWTPTDRDSVPAWLMTKPNAILCAAASDQVWADHPWSSAMSPVLRSWVADQFKSPAALRKELGRTPELLQIPVFQTLAQRHDLRRATAPPSARSSRRVSCC